MMAVLGGLGAVASQSRNERKPTMLSLQMQPAQVCPTCSAADANLIQLRFQRKRACGMFEMTRCQDISLCASH